LFTQQWCQTTVMLITFPISTYIMLSRHN
jgi:hypothetical protein